MNFSRKHLKHIRFKKISRNMCLHFICIYGYEYNAGDPDMCRLDCTECAVPVEYKCPACGNFDEVSGLCMLSEVQYGYTADMSENN